MKRALVVTIAVILAIAVGTFFGSVAAGWTPKHGWPGYCSTHPRSTQPACEVTTTTVPASTTTTTVPVTTTTTTEPATTTTIGSTFTGCIVVANTDPSVILWEGDCSGADTYVSETTRATLTVPVSDWPTCVPSPQAECRY